MAKKRIVPSTIRLFDGKRYYILTKEIPKHKALPIAKSYRRAGDQARVVKTANGYTVYVRGKR